MHSFDPDIAQRVGVHAAVLYQNIVWWCAKNAANGHNQHDGHHWTYNSVRAWSELFPYMTAKQIRTSLDRLEADGMILSGEYNKSAYDRTKWFCPTSQVELPHRASQLAAEGKPIPVVNTDIKPVGKQDKAGKPPVINEASEIFDCLAMWASEAAVKSFIEYRKKSKSKGLTLTAAKRLASTLQEIFNAGENPDDALGLAEERGWQTVKADWYFQSQRTPERGNARQGSGMAAAFASVAADIVARERRRAENPEDLNDANGWGVDGC
jgi:hypothetical protein